MNDDTQITPSTTPASSSGDDSPVGAPPPPQKRELIPLPGLAAIGLYMLVLAGISILGVASGKFPPVFLVFSATFIAAALGLLMLFRWAWALTLGAVALLVALFGWKFAVEHQAPFIVQGLLNLVFFLYLVRTEVRSKLK
jgi:hypothetical protein